MAATAKVKQWEDVPSGDNWQDVPTGGPAWEDVQPAKPALAPVQSGTKPSKPAGSRPFAADPPAGSALLTPEEHATDQLGDRTEANRAELERGIRDAPTPEAKAVLYEERARIAAPATAAPDHGPEGSAMEPSVAPSAAAPHDANYNTILTPEEERQFVDWKGRFAPKDSGADYDLRGAFKAGIKPSKENGHWPDTYKKPNHPTFSDQSNYAQYGQPGKWEGEKFIPPVPRPTLHLPPKPTAAIKRKPVMAVEPPPKPKVEAPRQPRELTPVDTVPGFVFNDFIPGAIEGQAAGLWNAGADAAMSIPALIGAAASGGRKGEGDYIDRFKELHEDMTRRVHVEPQTATGQRSSQLQGELIEAGLDAVGGAIAQIAGPAIGAFVKGSLAAVATVAGAKALKGSPETPISRVNEPRFDPLSQVSNPRPEPTMSRVPDVGGPKEPTFSGNLRVGGVDPRLGAEPQLPPAPRIEKPRIVGPAATVSQKPRIKGPAATLGPEVSTPPGSMPKEPTSSAVPGAPVPKIADPVLDAPVAAGTFALPAAQPPARPAETALGEIPQAPRTETPEPKAEFKGFDLPDPDAEYSAVRQISSDTREGGVAGGKQHVKLPQNVFWKGPTGKLDAWLFDAGKQFREEGTKQAAFDRLQTAMRYFLLEDKSIPEAAKAPYRQFLTDDGKQINRDKLMRGAVGYNVRVSTAMNNARRASEGQGVAIEAPSWRGDDMPTPQPTAPKAGPKSAEPVTDEDALNTYGPGTLGANPMFDPAMWKKTLASMSKIADTTSKPVRAWFDAAQAVPDTALPALASSWEYARKVAAAKQQAEADIYHKTDVNMLQRDYRGAMAEAVSADPKYMTRDWVKPPTTAREAIQQIELARRQVAKVELQADLVNSGLASPVPMPGYKQSHMNLADLKSSSGRPLYVREDALKVVNQMVGAHDVAQQTARSQSLLGAAEGINQSSVGLIMYNPGFHAVTVAGRAAPFILNKAGTNSVLKYLPEGSRKLADRDFMYDLMKNRGYQPMRIRESQAALGGQMGTVEKIFRQTGLDKPYDFWRTLHNKVMVDTVNRIQMSVYLMKVEDFVKQGMPRDAAETAAARMSNLIGGNLPKEEMNQLWHQILGGTMFSRSYTSTVVRQATRAIVNDKILMAELTKRGHTPETVAKAVQAYKGDLAKALILDYATMQVTGNLINYAMTADVEDRYGDKKRHFSWDNMPKGKPMGTKPDKMDYAFPDRIAIGMSKDDKPQYMENPLRTTRDQMLFFMQGKELAAGERPTWLWRKIGALAGSGIETAQMRDQQGRPMRDTLDVAANIGSRMTPLDFKTPAEAIRMASFDYFMDSLKGALSDPKMIALKVGGLQPHEETKDSAIGASAKVTKEQNKVWAEAAEIKRNWPKLGEKARADALRRLNKIGEPVGIKSHTLEKYLESAEASKTQRKKVNKASEFLEVPQ